jgi:phosphatidate cytidylyltransferase
MSELVRRVVVAAVGIPLVIFLCIAGGFYFFGFVAILSALALYEFYGLTASKGARPQVVLGLIVGFLMTFAFVSPRAGLLLAEFLEGQGLALPTPSMTQYILILLLVSIPVALILELFRTKGSAISNLSMTVLGWMYVSLFFGALVGLREVFNPYDFPVSRHFDIIGPSVPVEVQDILHRWGGLTMVSVFASIWACDSGAYFVGRALGKHPLFKRVSPNKTWEGAIGGFVFAIAVFAAARFIALPYLSVVQAIVCGGMIGLFGQVGDLVESLLKRSAGVKDSSALIPGHGGVLDRFDSLMFVAPLLFLYLEFIVFAV